MFSERKMSFEQSWISRLVFSLIGTAAIIGNTLVLWLYFKKRQKFNKTAFDIFIIGLAVSDLLAGIFMFFSEYVFQPAIAKDDTRAIMYCSLLWGGFFLFSLGHVSIYICCVLSIERWLALVKPHYYRRVKVEHAIVILIIILIWTFILNTENFFVVKPDFEKNVCKWVHLAQTGNGLAITAICLKSFVPFSIIIIFYSCLILEVRGTKHIKETKVKFKRRLTIIVLVASLALIVGWLPNEISYMMLFTSSNQEYHLHGTVHVIFTMLAMSNSFINPILYGIYSSKFRHAYKEVFNDLLFLLHTFPKCTNEESQNTEQTPA